MTELTPYGDGPSSLGQPGAMPGSGLPEAVRITPTLAERVGQIQADGIRLVGSAVLNINRLVEAKVVSPVLTHDPVQAKFASPTDGRGWHNVSGRHIRVAEVDYPVDDDVESGRMGLLMEFGTPRVIGGQTFYTKTASLRVDLEFALRQGVREVTRSSVSGSESSVKYHIDRVSPHWLGADVNAAERKLQYAQAGIEALVSD